MDTGLSPARAVANVRRAVGRHAVAIVDEGTGIDASWRVADRAGVPIGVVFEGGAERHRPGDAAETSSGSRRPTTASPSGSPSTSCPKGLKLAIIHDDSDYGAAGEQALRSAFSGNRSSVAADLTVAVGRARPVRRSSSARGRPARPACSCGGGPRRSPPRSQPPAQRAGTVPFYTPPTGADPFVRQQLADHPAWVDGLTFASGRLTAEVGRGPFQAFEQRLESAYGVERVGVRTRAGREVIQPPETAMYAYDFVNLARRRDRQGGLDGAAPRSPRRWSRCRSRARTATRRGFNENNHEGVDRRRHLLRAVPRHDVRARAGRRPVEDPAADSPAPVRVVVACSVAAVLVAAPAARATPPRLVSLPSPLTPLSATPPIGGGARRPAGRQTAPRSCDANG